jgi:hypothetical protein
VPADPADNLELRSRWTQPVSDLRSAAPRLWLGAAVAIKEPTQVVFRRQSGAHLLIVGQQDDLASGVMGCALLGLGANGAKSHPGVTAIPPTERACRTTLLDGGGFEAEAVRLSAVVARWRLLDLEVATPPDTNRIMARWGEELDRRLAESSTGTDHEPMFLAVHNLARFRDLRRSEDDFGLGSFSSESSLSAAAQFGRILREGPAVGMHCLIWCDTYNNLTRWFERSALRDLGYRVLFQMSATDSSNLMDSNTASQLGSYRAVLYDDERGESERFRPYRLPDESLVQLLRQSLEECKCR